jgi:hypothetical protein
MMSNVKRRGAEAGYSLAELTTAIAVFVVVMTAALLVYDRSNRVFSQNAQSADMQQATRVAYEKILQDVRLAGYDYKRAGVPTSAYPIWQPSVTYAVGQMILALPSNGYIYQCTVAGTSGTSAPTNWTTTVGGLVAEGGGPTWKNVGRLAAAFDQPDEQIEYVWSSAITVRGNYNYDVPDDANHYDHGRERNLESSQFPVVTTGNDEIVTYGLVSNAPNATNPDTISFYADVNNGGAASRTAYPGGNAERLISITGVDLSNAHPPYTLYRFTLDSAGAVVRTPLAENIRSLNFHYWQDAKATIPLRDLAATPNVIDPPNLGGDAQYDPSTPSTANLPDRKIRRTIRAVTVDLVGMNSQSDPNFNDGDAVVPTYRKMALSTTIVPRNLGIRTLPLSAVQIPPQPTNINVCVGYCGIALISWQPGDPSTLSSTGSTGDESYSIVWDTAENGNYTNWMPAGQLTTFAADLTQQDLSQQYWFKIAATNNVGTAFTSAVGPFSLKNATKPASPTLNVATSIPSGVPTITLSWSAPTTNASGSVSCTTGSAPYALLPTEQQGFKIYRNTTGSTPAESDVISNIGSAGQITAGNGQWTYVDTSIVTCQTYYYWVKVCEWCQTAAQNASGDATDGFSDLAAGSGNVSTQPPRQVTGTNATGTCDWSSNACSGINLTWTKVTQDTASSPNTIQVDQYIIQRRTIKHAPTVAGGGTIVSDFTQVAAPTGLMNVASPSWNDTTSLQDHDGSDLEPYFYVYRIKARTPCGDSATWSDEVYVPPLCDTHITISQTGALSGSGTAANPWQAPASINLTASSGTIQTVYYSLDGSSLQTLASPYHYAKDVSPPSGWVDNYNGATHSLIFIVKNSATSCYQRLTTVYYQESTLGCHLATGLSSVVSAYTVPNGYLSNTYDNGFNIKLQNLIPISSITVQSITVNVTVPPKNIAGGNSSGNTFDRTPVMWPSYTWSSSSPAPTTNPAPCPGSVQNGATACTMTFTPPSADATINALSTKTFQFLFSHKNQGSVAAPTSSAFTGISVTYRQNSCSSCASNTFTCAIVP